MAELVEPAAAAPAAPVTGRAMQLLLLTVAATAGAYARTTISPLQEAMRTTLGLGDNYMALLQGAALALPPVIAAVPLGLLIDSKSRVRLLVLLGAVNIVGSVLTAYAPNFAMLFLARSLVGLTATAINPTALSLLADLYALAQRGRATMVIAVGQYAGMSAAFAAGGALLELSGEGADAWRSAMLWLTAPLCAVVLLTLAMREPLRTGIMVKNSSPRTAFAELWRYRLIISPLLIGVVMVEIAIGAVLVWAAPTLSRNFSLDAARTGAIVATGLMVSGILGPIAGGLLADLCQRLRGPRLTSSVLMLFAILNAPAGLFAIATDPTWASALLVMFMVLVSAIIVAGTTLFTVVIPNELRGLCVSLSVAASVLFGVGLAPLLVSLLSNAMGGPATIGRALAVVVVSTTLLGALAFGLSRKHIATIAQ